MSFGNPNQLFMSVRLIIAVLFMLGGLFPVQVMYGQHTIYFSGDSVIKTRVVLISTDTLYLEQPNQLVKFSNSAVDLIFDNQGNYLTKFELLSNNQETRDYIGLFIKLALLPSNVAQNRVILKSGIQLSQPIDSISRDTLFLPNNRKIAKGDISVIIFKDGTHQTFDKSSKVARVLFDIRTSQKNTLPELDKKRLGQYQQKALSRVDEFGLYLQRIANKELDADEKDKAIDEACKLFLEDAVIEVSSKKTGKVTPYKIRDYLTRLKLLPHYGNVQISWTDINYVEEMKQTIDGNYMGTIRGAQRFVGYSSTGKVLYSDITNKEVQVQLKSYSKIVDGRPNRDWEVLLGSIGVVLTQ